MNEPTKSFGSTSLTRDQLAAHEFLSELYVRLPFLQSSYKITDKARLELFCCLFGIARETIKQHPGAIFSAHAISEMVDYLRPLVTKWRCISPNTDDLADEFRNDLAKMYQGARRVEAKLIEIAPSSAHGRVK